VVCVRMQTKQITKRDPNFPISSVPKHVLLRDNSISSKYHEVRQVEMKPKVETHQDRSVVVIRLLSLSSATTSSLPPRIQISFLLTNKLIQVYINVETYSQLSYGSPLIRNECKFSFCEWNSSFTPYFTIAETDNFMCLRSYSNSLNQFLLHDT